jgi:hypothetical protein
VWMSSTFVPSLEEERRVHERRHQDCTRGREPEVELLGPSSKQRRRERRDDAASGHSQRPRCQIGVGNCASRGHRVLLSRLTTGLRGRQPRQPAKHLIVHGRSNRSLDAYWSIDIAARSIARPIAATIKSSTTFQFVNCANISRSISTGRSGPRIGMSERSPKKANSGTEVPTSARIAIRRREL